MQQLVNVWVIPLTRVTSAPNSTPRLFPSYLLLILLFSSFISLSIFYFPGAPYRIFLLFHPCHFLSCCHGTATTIVISIQLVEMYIFQPMGYALCKRSCGPVFESRDIFSHLSKNNCIYLSVN